MVARQSNTVKHANWGSLFPLRRAQKPGFVLGGARMNALRTAVSVGDHKSHKIQWQGTPGQVPAGEEGMLLLQRTFSPTLVA